MSEFSESYHLKTLRPEDAVEMLRDAGLKGYVFPATNGWVTFLAEDGTFEPDERLTMANEKQLLHYVSAEDHGWSFSIFDGVRKVCEYRCKWDDDVDVEDSGYSPAVLGRLIAEQGVATLAEVEAAFHPASIEEVWELEAAQRLAKAVGLEHYEWLNYEHLAQAFHEDSKAYAHVIKVA